MPRLLSTNQLIATDFTPVNGCLPGEARSIGHLPRNKSRWIQWYQESIATHVDNVYGYCGGSSQKGDSRGYGEKTTTKKQLTMTSDRLVGTGQAESPAIERVLISTLTSYGKTLVLSVCGGCSRHAYQLCWRTTFYGRSIRDNVSSLKMVNLCTVVGCSNCTSRERQYLFGFL